MKNFELAGQNFMGLSVWIVFLVSDSLPTFYRKVCQYNCWLIPGCAKTGAGTCSWVRFHLLSSGNPLIQPSQIFKLFCQSGMYLFICSFKTFSVKMRAAESWSMLHLGPS